MKTNREWLNELAANDVDALQAWFDAPRADCGQVDATDVDNLSDERDRLNRRNSELRIQYDKLKRENEKLSHDLAESERFREELREELSIAYDHAHDLLARRDRGLA